MFDFIKKYFKNSTEPNYKKSRPNCPFYGFHSAPGILVDQDGNECALIIESYSPCLLERTGDKPDWDKCCFNDPKNKQVLEQIAKSVKVFPSEFFPKNKTSLKGMPFKEWANYIKNLNQKAA
jgi:hypothetical protein